MWLAAFLALSVQFNVSNDAAIWRMPLAFHQVTSGYGLRPDPWTGKTRIHTGIDLHAGEGAQIHSVGAGEVIFSGRYSGYGNLVSIRHGHIITTHYGHCSKVLVRVGEIVPAGALIALAGHSGRTTGNHLHFEIRISGKSIDPSEILASLG